MFVIEASRRTSRAAVERIRKTFLEYDRVVYKEVQPPAEKVYTVVRTGKREFALSVDDPSLA